MFDFPEVYVAVDEASLEGQRHFVRSTRIQLVLLVIASAAGSLSWTINQGWDGTALLAGIAFGVAAVLRLLLLRARPHRAWYDGRAAAESVKTLVWKYSVGGDPFLIGESGSRPMFQTLARDVVASFDSLGPDIGRLPAAATPSMNDTRDLPLSERRTLYARDRIEDQRLWYKRKAESNQWRARVWGVVVLTLQVSGAVGAFLKGFGVVDIDLFGLAGAAVGSAVAWLETKQHHSIARAYKVAAEELTDIHALIDEQQTEQAWSGFVAEAEEAISREHTMWKASSRSRVPVSLA